MKPKLLLILGTIIFLPVALLSSPKNTEAAYPWEPSYNMGQTFTQELNAGPNLVNWMGHLVVYGIQFGDTLVNGTSQQAMGEESTQFAGLLGYSTVAVGATYNAQTPFATTTYLASLNPVKTAFAAPSTGTAHLQFILSIWKVCRNISYFLITIALVIVGFLIMFRRRLDPITEITLVAALPKIIVALLLITFSFAIGGFMFDLAALSKRVMGNTLASLEMYENPADVKFPQEFAFYDIFNNFGMGAFKDAFKGNLEGNIEIPTGVTPISLNVGGLFGTIVGFAIFSVMMKLLMSLIKYFAQWFLFTAFGPFFIAIGALPNMSEIISWWLKKLFVSVIVFPATYFVLNLAFYIKKVLALSSEAAQTLPSAPFLGVPDPSTPEQSKLLGSLIAWGLVLASASLPQAIENALSGDIEGRTDGVDLSRAAQKIPIIGGLMS
ncbi:MAG: hypothetical protein U9M98_00595 [Patescibacteria group bacterium]|nr:hypothetical protein [Patescibacteria group bacterium]